MTILEGRTVGSDGANMETRIRFDASTREWVFSNFKRYISNAGKADAYIVWGITDPNVAPPKGMSALLVPAVTPGLSFPGFYNFMGWRSSAIGEVKFQDVRAPAAYSPDEKT